jgi:hypothetical protein
MTAFVSCLGGNGPEHDAGQEPDAGEAEGEGEGAVGEGEGGPVLPVEIVAASIVGLINPLRNQDATGAVLVAAEGLARPAQVASEAYASIDGASIVFSGSVLGDILFEDGTALPDGSAILSLGVCADSTSNPQQQFGPGAFLISLSAAGFGVPVATSSVQWLFVEGDVSTVVGVDFADPNNPRITVAHLDTTSLTTTTLFSFIGDETFSAPSATPVDNNDLVLGGRPATPWAVTGLPPLSADVVFARIRRDGTALWSLSLNGDPGLLPITKLPDGRIMLAAKGPTTIVPSDGSSSTTFDPPAGDSWIAIIDPVSGHVVQELLIPSADVVLATPAGVIVSRITGPESAPTNPIVSTLDLGTQQETTIFAARGGGLVEIGPADASNVLLTVPNTTDGFDFGTGPLADGSYLFRVSMP